MGDRRSPPSNQNVTFQKKCKGEKDIKDAKEIIDRIHRRDLYRLVGEHKMSWRGRPKKEVHYNPHIDVVFVTKTKTIFSKIPYDVFPSSLANCPIRLLSPSP